MNLNAKKFSLSIDISDSRNDLNGLTFPQFVTSVHRSTDQNRNHTKLVTATKDICHPCH